VQACLRSASQPVVRIVWKEPYHGFNNPACYAPYIDGLASHS